MQAALFAAKKYLKSKKPSNLKIVARILKRLGALGKLELCSIQLNYSRILYCTDTLNKILSFYSNWDPPAKAIQYKFEILFFHPEVF